MLGQRNFRMGCTSSVDAPRAGRPREATDPVTVERVSALVMKDRRTTLNKLADAVGISKECGLSSKSVDSRRELG